MLTGIIIVSYHNEEGTVRYIKEELSKLTDDIRIVVVAVDSDTVHAQAIAERCGLSFVDNGCIADSNKGWVVYSQENLGYAKGNNFGVQFLQQTGLKFDYYLFSNDDITIVNNHIISQLAQGMQSNGNTGGIGPRVIALDGTDQSPHRKYISPQRLIGWRLLPFLRKKQRKNIHIDRLDPIANISKRNRKELDSAKILASASPTPPDPGECYWVSGAFIMVCSECFNQAGGFDDRTFLYYEEVILAERFKLKGWIFRYEPSVCVIHYEGGSTDIKSKKRDAIEMQSRLLYYCEYMHVNRLMLWLYKVVCG